jgi:hypothetical protein
MKRLCMFGGLLLALAGAWLPLGAFAISTTIGLDLPEAARGAAQSRFLWGEMPAIGVGIALVIAGIWLASRDPRPRAG